MALGGRRVLSEFQASRRGPASQVTAAPGNLRLLGLAPAPRLQGQELRCVGLCRGRSICGPPCPVAQSPESGWGLEHAVPERGCRDDEEASYF